MNENLDRWQGIEQEFRITPKPRGTYAREVIDSLSNYHLGGQYQLLYLRTPSLLRAGGFLRNGSRIYQCSGGHLEITTPECRNAFQAALYDKATEFIAQLGAERASDKVMTDVQCWKANVEADGKYTRGTHESYLVQRGRFQGKQRLLIPFLILRNVLTGAGGYIGDQYLISPRSTMTKKVFSSHRYWPVLSNRDQPLASKDKFRIHVPSGEGLRSPVTRLLNNGMTSYVITAIESGKIEHVPGIKDPLKTLKHIAHSLSDWQVELRNNMKIGAIEYLNSYYLPSIEELFEERETSFWDEYTLQLYKRLTEKLDEGLIEDPYVVKRLEWPMKRWVIENEIGDFEYEGEDKKLAASFQFTNVCDHDLYERVKDELGAVDLFDQEETGQALISPPKNSRASLRGKLHEQFPESWITWNRIAFQKTHKRPASFHRLQEIIHSSRGRQALVHSRGPSGSRGDQLRAVIREIRALGRGRLEPVILIRLTNRGAQIQTMGSRVCSVRFDRLDGWDEDRVQRKVEEIKEVRDGYRRQNKRDRTGVSHFREF